MPHVDYKGWPSASQLKELFPKPSIDLWILKVGKEKADQALISSQDFGTYVHDMIEGYLLGGDRIIEEGSFESNLLGSVERFLTFNSLTAKHIEKHLINENSRIHGTPDLVCELTPDEWVVVDWKTGGMIDGLAFIQLTIYAYMISNKHGVKCKTGYFCKVDKITGELTPIRVERLDEWAWLVEGLSKIWWTRKNKETKGDAPSSSLS